VRGATGASSWAGRIRRKAGPQAHGRTPTAGSTLEINNRRQTLSTKDQQTIVNFIIEPKEEDYGRVANQSHLVLWIADHLAPAAGTRSPWGSLKVALQMYFAQKNIRIATHDLNKRVKDGPPSTKIVVAAAVPGDPDRPAIEYGGWIAYMHTLNANNNHKDARGLTFRQYDDEFRNLTNPSDASTSVLNFDPTKILHHGHHIIFKKSSEFDVRNSVKSRVEVSESRKYASDAKEILLYYGIDPY